MSAGISQTGRCRRIDKQTGFRDHSVRKSTVLLLRMVKHQVCGKRDKKRIQTRVGGNDRKTVGFCQ